VLRSTTISKEWLRMSAREIVQAYFEELKQRGRWEAFLADDLTFTSLTTSPITEVT